MEDTKKKTQERLLTPQQELFLERYTNPKSPTFGNATQSALEAKYSQTYSENITDAMPEWLLENIGDMKRLVRAEKNLTEVQNLPIFDLEGKPDTQLIEKRTKVDMFIAERLNKNKYSTKTEANVDLSSRGEKITGFNYIVPNDTNNTT